MAKVLIDKTERHFDVHLDDLKDNLNKELEEDNNLSE
jgi:hypothetical protein